MAKIYTFISTKGGVGKTSLSANLAAIMADMGQRVLMIDTDPAANLSKFYPVAYPATAGLTKLVTQGSHKDCIGKTGFGLDLVVMDDKGDKGGVILPFLRESTSHILYLRHALKGLMDDYDYIIIDTQGAAGLLQEAVILASDELISPVPPNYLDSTEFVSGTVAMLRGLQMPGSKKTITGEPLPICNAVINRMGRTNDAREVVSWLRKTFDEQGDGLVRVLNTIVPDISVYNKSAGASLPAHRYEPKRRGATASALDTMVEFAVELQPRLTGVTPQWQ
jgi:chromosome partitioning related protein ParA